MPLKFSPGGCGCGTGSGSGSGSTGAICLGVAGALVPYALTVTANYDADFSFAVSRLGVASNPYHYGIGHYSLPDGFGGTRGAPGRWSSPATASSTSSCVTARPGSGPPPYVFGTAPPWSPANIPTGIPGPCQSGCGIVNRSIYTGALEVLSTSPFLVRLDLGSGRYLFVAG